MKADFCTRCNPLPKVNQRSRTGAGRHTEDFVLNEDLKDMLCAKSTDPDMLRALLDAEELPMYGSFEDLGCIFLKLSEKAVAWERGLPVTLKDGSTTLTSAARLAYALAKVNEGHPLREGQAARHLCPEHRRGNVRECCVNPAHIEAE